MSQQQQDVILEEIHACFGAWTPETPIPQLRTMWNGLFINMQSRIGAERENVLMGSVTAEKIHAPGANSAYAVLYLHGGGYTFGSPLSHRDLTEHLSDAAGADVYTVDYRLAPEHPYPAALEDATGAYQWLLAQGFKPAQIVIAGDSAGGGLALATLLWLKDHGVPLPSCAALMSPWVDLENRGETFASKAAEDPIVQKQVLDGIVRLYVPEGSLRHPYMSPLYGDLSGLPPLMIQVGTRETLLDDSRRIAQRATSQGVEVTLEIGQDLIHVWQIYASRLDEAAAALDRMGSFIRRHC